MIHPIGFLSDHMEVLFDLDEEARTALGRAGPDMVRSGTVGVHPGFVSMLGELILERIGDTPDPERRACGQYGPNHDVCPELCCLPPARPGMSGPPLIGGALNRRIRSPDRPERASSDRPAAEGR